MHPRLERVAVDGSDDIDGVTRVRTSGTLPDGFGIARRLTVG